MGGRGGAPRTNLATAVAQAAARAETPATPAAPQSLETQIQQAIQQLEASPRGLVSLVRLRDSLSGVSREALDAELKRLDRARVIQLDPEVNQKILTPEIRNAGVKLGPEVKHYVSRIG